MASLFDAPVKRSIQDHFDAFHEANPQIFDLFRSFAEQARRAGHRHYSADAILHRIRWHMTVETTGGGVYKLNDHFTSRYARLLMETDPSFAGFFELRILKG